jgi:xanthine dehydrogenase accessory factor
MTATSGIYHELMGELQAGHRAVVVTRLDLKPAMPAPVEKLLYTENSFSQFSESGSAWHDLALTALNKGELQCQTGEDNCIWIAEPYFAESRLIILGGGHIARPLAEFAAKCGFAVTVVDDRPAFANKQRFPYAKQVICESFDRCFPLLNISGSCFIVIITRGHRHDLDCLRQVLRLETAYTGMIGSRRRVRGAREQLKDEGYPPDKLDAVRAPIGLDIGAQTPEEISISILSEIIQYKRMFSKSNWSELDMEVLSELSATRDEPRALVTIIETKGSVPRDAGAKMIVWPHSRTLGSIGGGCSEGEVISAAYDVIRDGGFLIMDIDMTGEVAEDIGMVCGGTMKVIIEKIQ